MAAGAEDISILNDYSDTATISKTPTYTVYQEGDYNYQIDSENPQTLIAPDGTPVAVSTAVLKESSQFTAADGSIEYDNYSSTLTPISIVLGHQEQLPIQEAQLQPDGSYIQNYQTYAYETINGSSGSGSSTGTGSGGDTGTSTFNPGPTPVVLAPGLGAGVQPDPATIADIAAPIGSDLYADNGQVYEFTDGQPLGFVEVVDSSNVLPPGYQDISGDTPTQVVVDAVQTDPITAATVQVDYDLSGTASSPITSVADVPSDTGHDVRDAYTSFWDDGGGVNPCKRRRNGLGIYSC